MGAAVFLLARENSQTSIHLSERKIHSNRRSEPPVCTISITLSYLLGNLILGHLGVWEASEMGESFPRKRGSIAEYLEGGRCLVKNI